MAIFGPKSTPIPPFAEGRGPVRDLLANELTRLDWTIDGPEVLSKNYPVEGIDGSLKVYFGTWNHSQYGVWMQIGRTTVDGKVPYPFTRVKILPYGLTNFGMMLTLVRLWDAGATPNAAGVDATALQMSKDMWDIRNKAGGYGPIS